MLFHLVEQPADAEHQNAPPFEITAPGRLVRERRSAMLPSATYAPVRPLRLGHILVFSPDVLRSVWFVTDALAMGLADRAGRFIPRRTVTAVADQAEASQAGRKQQS